MKKICSVLICTTLALSLFAGCTSDYPVIDRQLDISELINSCFAGSGYNVELDDAQIVVSAVADRMFIDMDQSEDAVSSVRDAVRKATSQSTGLIGTWVGKVDISPAICSCLAELPKINVADYFHDIWVTAELTFTENGLYMLRFSKASVASAREQMLAAGAATTKGYLASSSSAVAKIVGGALSDDSIADIIFYVVNFAEEMLDSGSAGYYSVNGATLTLDDVNRFNFVLELSTPVAKPSGNNKDSENAVPVSSADVATAAAPGESSSDESTEITTPVSGESQAESTAEPAEQVTSAETVSPEEISGGTLTLTAISKNMDGMASILSQGAVFTR